MQLKTILNRVEKYKSFVYGEIKLLEQGDDLSLEIKIEPRANGRALCSGCAQPAPGYDQLRERRFEFVPLWGIAVYFVYALRRVACPGCGVKVERVPWAEGKGQLTTTYQWFLARWAKRLSWSEVAASFQTTWDKVAQSVAMAVAWGLAQRDLTGIKAIGVDEIQWRRGHKYLTVVYQIDEGAKRLLWAPGAPGMPWTETRRSVRLRTDRWLARSTRAQAAIGQRTLRAVLARIADG